jgi:hypothetical protein
VSEVRQGPPSAAPADLASPTGAVDEGSSADRIGSVCVVTDTLFLLLTLLVFGLLTLAARGVEKL